MFHLLLPHDLRQGLASCFCRGADGHCVRLWNSNTPCTVCEACTICRQVGVAGLHKTVFGGCEVYQVFTYQAILSFDLKKAFKNTKSMIVCQPLLLLLSCFSRVRLCVTPQMAAHQAPPSLGFSRQEYWSGLPCPPPGDLPDPGIEPASLALQAYSLMLSHWGSPLISYMPIQNKKLKKKKDKRR